LGNASSFSEDDEDMLMVKSLDYKLRASKASDIMSESLLKLKKARKVILDQPVVVGGPGSSKHRQIVGTYFI
jgi:hypothetical protein